MDATETKKRNRFALLYRFGRPNPQTNKKKCMHNLAQTDFLMLFDMQNDYFQKKEKTTFGQNIGASTKLLLACCCIPVTLFNFDICSMTINQARRKQLQIGGGGGGGGAHINFFKMTDLCNEQIFFFFFFLGGGHICANYWGARPPPYSYGPAIFRKKKLFWPFDPTQESRMRVRAKFLLVWCRVFHSL